MKLVHCSSDVGDVVLDPFLGSGTTAVACERLGRKWVGIEIEEEFCKVARKRIEEELRVRKLF
jgi:site-specific DNA-methyltransferase (adenine-specific)